MRRIEIDRALGLGVAHAGGWLVEQDHAGAARHGDADLERALLGIGEHARRHDRLREIRPISLSTCWVRWAISGLASTERQNGVFLALRPTAPRSARSPTRSAWERCW